MDHPGSIWRKIGRSADKAIGEYGKASTKFGVGKLACTERAFYSPRCIISSFWTREKLPNWCFTALKVELSLVGEPPWACSHIVKKLVDYLLANVPFNHEKHRATDDIVTLRKWSKVNFNVNFSYNLMLPKLVSETEEILLIRLPVPFRIYLSQTGMRWETKTEVTPDIRLDCSRFQFWEDRTHGVAVYAEFQVSHGRGGMIDNFYLQLGQSSLPISSPEWKMKTSCSWEKS